MARHHRVLLTGATGFVGSRLEPLLREAGHEVTCASRDPEGAARRWPERRWTRLETDDPESVRRAMQGCTAAYFLVHSVGRGAHYPEREARAARVFADTAREVALERVVYLGGVAPSGRASRHLQSRLRTGEILRARAPLAIELRAAMIVGEGSASWQMVRDLAARLPAMILPRWTRFRSAPVAIDDVLFALVQALDLELDGSLWLDVPGPDLLTHAEMLRRVSRRFARRTPMMPVPVLTPVLSSYWVALVTDVPLPLARELVAGLESDLVPHGPSIWDRIPEHRRLSFDDAVERAFLEHDQSAEGRIARLAERTRTAISSPTPAW